MARVNRLPIRMRVTFAFTSVMAVVLAVVGMFVYLRLGDELDATIERGLRSRAGDVTALVQQADSGLAQSGRSPLTERGENLAQILDTSGHVIDSTPTLGKRPLLSPAQRAQAVRGTILVTSTPGDQPARLLATPVHAQGADVVVVVGQDLEARDRAVGNLGRLLLLGGPVVLLLSALAGYLALGAALRPVDSMRRRAAAIRDSELGERLPVPPAQDEIRRLGDTLNAMLARLESAFARERTFVSDASHELRTPMAILKTELEVALARPRSNEQLESALRSAAVEADRLVQLAEDLLVIARSDQGRLPISRGHVDAVEILEVVRKRFANRAQDQRVTLTVADAPGVRLDADHVRLEQAVGNLVENALRHGGKNVQLTAVQRAETVELHVSDDGAGFPEGFIATAFERFTRGDPARGRGGSGLGLAIVAAIARAHGGEAGASNAVGGGADVWLSLPSGW
jgi:two-component system OmpR family sensor kinase